MDAKVAEGKRVKKTNYCKLTKQHTVLHRVLLLGPVHSIRPALQTILHTALKTVTLKWF